MKETCEDLYSLCFQEDKMPALIREKAQWIHKLFPAERVVDVGGMWKCNGFYSFLSETEGAKDVILLDDYLSNRFNEIKDNFSNVRYIKMDFYKSMIDGGLRALGAEYPADAIICYDILLHQPEPIHFISNIIDSFSAKKAIFANPVISKSRNRSDLLFAPFSEKFKEYGDIYPSKKFGDPSGWIWIFSHGFLINCMRYLGLSLVEEKLIKWGRSLKWRRGLDYSFIIVQSE
jgi:hypothetical protein